MSVTAACGPIRRGVSCVPPHAGNSPRKTSGKPKWRTVLAIVRAEQCSASSEPAAEARAVDRRDGRERQRLDALEQLVTGAAALGGRLRRDVRELVDVGAGAEPEGLAR